MTPILLISEFGRLLNVRAEEIYQTSGRGECLKTGSSGPPLPADVRDALERAAEGVFVGRERERAQLDTALIEALGGRGRMFLIAGEPGIGKTRLAEHIAASATERGASVLWGRCWEGEGAPAFWPWVQVIRAYIRGCDAQMLAAQLGIGAPYVAQVVPELRELLPDVPAAPPLDSEQARGAAHRGDRVPQGRAVGRLRRRRAGAQGRRRQRARSQGGGQPHP